MYSLQSRQSAWWRSQRILIAIKGALGRLNIAAGEASKVAARPQLEPVEGRVLLSAYTPGVLENFGISPNGALPTSTLVADASGDLYGTTSRGGTQNAGTVFEISKGTTTVTTLVSFDEANEFNPQGSIVLDSSGNLYGTTIAGGPANDGAVYEVASGSKTVRTLAFFNGQNGSSPNGLTFDAAGNLYGTTASGTVFEVPNETTAITTVATLNATTGLFPQSTVGFDAAGNLYGAAEDGGAHNDGTVFEIPKGANSATALASFSGANGQDPNSLTVEPNGTLYGTTLGGGATAVGTIFEITSGSATIKALASFDNSISGSGSYGGVTLIAGGWLCGTTSTGRPNGNGTVFEVYPGDGYLTAIASFNGTNGSSPSGGVLLDASGDLYGTAEYGANGTGEVFEIPSGATNIQPLAVFAAAGWAPNGATTRDAAGNFWGVSPQGGSSGYGSVFELPHGSNLLTTVATFSNADGGEGVNGALTLDGSGNIYGTTSIGTSNDGNVFEIAKGSSTITVLASFNGTNGLIPLAGVALDPAGDIYGTTSGQSVNGGTVFEIARGSNTITTLVSFTASSSSANGWDPQASVTLDAAGNLYGTTYAGGPDNDGTVFEFAKGSNTITTLATFLGANGNSPDDSVTLDSAGNLYGTTAGGGAFGFGTIFEIPKGASALTTLASFNSTDGSDPQFAVILDPAGNLYGTTTQGGPGGGGTVFEIARGTNTITDLSSFSSTTGYANTPGQLMQDGLGNLYVTTTVGSDQLLELAANSAVTLTPASAPNPSDAAQPLNFAATVSGGLPDGETVTLEDSSNNNAVVATGALSGGSATLTVPAGTLIAGTHNLIAVYSGDANFAASESAPYAQIVLASPTVTGITSASGPAGGGTSVIINGTGFTGATAVDFGTTPASTFTINSTGTQITALDPAGSGTVDVTVIGPGGTSATSVADQFTYLSSAPISIASVVINGNNSALAGVQRSMVDSIVYTFNQAVNLAATNAFSIASNSTFATGTLPTLIWTALSPNADGSSTQWAVTFSGAGVLNGSIADGVYDITINGSAVTADASPAVTGTSRTDTFYRLFGDAAGTGSVTGADYNALLSTFNLKTTAAGYLGYFNEDGASKIDAPNYNAFLANFGNRFKNVTTITTI